MSAASAAKDFRLRVTVRNNVLLEAIEAAGYRMGPAACAALGVDYMKVASLIAMRAAPVDADGQWKPVVHQLAAALGRAPEELFRLAHLTPLAKPTVERKADLQEVVDLLCAPEPSEPIAALEQRELVDAVDATLATLPERERVVVERHVIGGESLADVAADLGLTLKRVRAVEARALRRLRHPSRAAMLLEFCA